MKSKPVPNSVRPSMTKISLNKKGLNIPSRTPQISQYNSFMNKTNEISKNLDFSKLESEYVVVVDADRVGDVLTSGASFVKVLIEVNSYKGGHSGNDIDDETRVNAVKLIAELMNDNKTLFLYYKIIGSSGLQY